MSGEDSMTTVGWCFEIGGGDGVDLNFWGAVVGANKQS